MFSLLFARAPGLRCSRRAWRRGLAGCALGGMLAAVGIAAVDVVLEPASAPAEFAATEIRRALAVTGASARVQLRESPAVAAEGFGIDVRGDDAGPVITVTGGGSGGVMYGGLEVAEQIRLRGVAGVQPMSRAPHFAMRGVKFNLPLDVRTPSYTDMSDSAQANIATVWDFDFWRDFLDALARHRYNYVSLWNLNPFPSLVEVPEYPGIALDDVQRTTAKLAEHYAVRAEDVSSPAMLAQVTTVRKLTIREKIDFWRRVMAYARDRHIEFYVVTWNIYPFGTAGKYGITDAMDNPVTRDYYRRSVAQLLRTYPLLRGIGVTAGENMGQINASFQAKEDWLFATYGQGVLDVAREQPGRKIRFIHRQHETKAGDIARTFAPLIANPDIDFVFSFKYAQAHVMSSTTQTFHRAFVESLDGMKTLWTLRNDDALMFRWGAPDFVRDFIKGMPAAVTQGVYYGSDMWVWGREFLSRQPTEPRQLEIDKHWLDWLLWGRLSYDPTLGNDRIAELMGARFPGVPTPTLLAAWQHASMVYPLTTGFHWGQYDFQWYVEACFSREEPAQTKSGFHDVNRFITLGVHPGTNNVPIPKYVDAVIAGQTPGGTTPLEVAIQLHHHADAALAALASLPAGGTREWVETLGDIRAMALLGKYYGCKIRGATALALYRRTGDQAQQDSAVAQLTEAAVHWEAYTAQASALYKNPLWTNRVGLVDWEELRTEVARDIAIAREPVTR